MLHYNHKDAELGYVLSLKLYSYINGYLLRCELVINYKIF